MTSVPSYPFDDATIAPRVRLAVFLGPEDGSAIAFTDGDLTTGELVEYLVPLTIERSAGMRGLDRVTLAYDLGATGERLVNVQTPTEWNRQIEIRIEDDAFEPVDWSILFWGDLVAQDLRIDRTSETVLVFGSIDPHHFGDPCDGYDVFDPINETTLRVFRDPIFNPLLEGKIWTNKASRVHAITTPIHSGGLYSYFLWVEPYSIKSSRARTVANEPLATKFDVTDAVDSLSKMLNPTEDFIRNPETLEDPIFDDAPDPDNIKVKRGEYLPKYLDALLPPHGFGWYVAQTKELSDEDDPDSTVVATRRIRIFKIGEGPEKEVWFQSPGSNLDLAEQNLHGFALFTDVGSIANRVECFGSLEEFEITTELYRGWNTDDDALTPDLLHKRTDLNPTSQYASKKNVWRLWVGNEGGDFSGLRTTGVAITPSAPLDLSSVFSGYVPRRRKLGPLLVREIDVEDNDTEGRRLPPRVEWLDSDSVWQSVTWPYELLHDQIGIYFSGGKPPDEFVKLGVAARLRITGTITGDARLTGTAARRTSSPNGRDVTLSLDVSDRFHFRQRVTEGVWDGQDPVSGLQAVFSSQYPDGFIFGTAEEDDTTAISTYAEKIQAVEESALMNVDLPLFGLNFSYEIGDLLTRINGREISFNRNSATATTKKYMQITGITHDLQNQVTKLSVKP